MNKLNIKFLKFVRNDIFIIKAFSSSIIRRGDFNIEILVLVYSTLNEELKF